MAQKCVHQGCGKEFTDPEEPCVYHPGPPVFHEGQKGKKLQKFYRNSNHGLPLRGVMRRGVPGLGSHNSVRPTFGNVQASQTKNGNYSRRSRQKHPRLTPNLSLKIGWKCCSTRVLTFDEFMEIPPCTTGVHSTTDKPPQLEEKRQPEDDAALNRKIEALNTSAAANNPGRAPVQPAQQTPAQPAPPPESEDDEPGLEIPDGAECRRKKCGVKYKKGSSREGEKCIHHPGVPIFHEGSKGYSCCKRRVLEFDQFLQIEGCETKDKHLFIGSGKKDKVASGGEEVLTTVRYAVPTLQYPL